ncbi:uncharacterized protein LOC106063555 isoform X2 [Biomphalaria glabrata]|uniref:Uncharacterized protein LOC106063555 isoform X2 n=1 Tax=Biomphalaria glabrata TaxID=6526 RepID=A0A9W3AES1_BIOGL|nr:uncharacterized protein LOC106063555 isoform X2 [Biomphalaria glabrata]
MGDNYEILRKMLLPWIVALAGLTVTTIVAEREEYVYEYNTQILTGLPLHSSIHSGYRVNAIARVQFSTKSKVNVQLENIRLYNIRQPITQIEAHENLIPEEYLKELTGSESTVIVESLTTPFGFDYENGQVKRALLAKKEMEWSANAKRGFVSLFEIKLKTKRLLEDRQLLAGEDKSYTSSYKVLETSAAGICSTLYTTECLSGNCSRQHVTKVRDYTQCLERPVYLQTKYDGFFPIGHSKDNPLTTGAVVKYLIEVYRGKPTILSAVAENRIVFSPYLNKGSVTTTVNQTLSLIQVKKSAIDIPDVFSLKVSLIMSLPSKSVDCQDPFELSKKSCKEPDLEVYSVDAIISQLKQAADNNLNIASRESLVHLGVVVEMLSVSPRTVIKSLWEKLTHSLNQTEQHARKILFNVLPHVGTEAAVNQVLDICSQDLDFEKCAIAFNILTLKATPTETLINKFISLVKQQDKMSPVMKQTAYLSLGSLGYKLAQAKNRQLKELMKIEQLMLTLQTENSEALVQKKREVEEKRYKIVNSFDKLGKNIVDTINELVVSGSKHSKILGLKALSNSGLPHAVPIFNKILANHEPHLYFRILAVLGHRRMYFDRTVREESLKTLLAVYNDKTEVNEVRSWAFITLMQLHPELPVIQTIARNLNSEKDAYVSGLVLSYLSSHANTTFYPFTTFVKNCSDALKFAPRSNLNYQRSFTNLVTKMYDSAKIGKVLSVTSIGSMNRFESWSFNLDTYVFGLYSNFLEVGINSMEVSQFLNKLFGPQGLLTMNKSIFDMLKRNKKSTSPQEMIEDIFKVLKIQSRKGGMPAAHLYLRVMGHELRYLDLSEYISSLMANGKMSIYNNSSSVFPSLPLDVKTMYYLMNTKMTLPTEAGYPVSLKLKVSKTLNVKGSVSLSVEPSIFEDERMGWPPKKVSASLDFRPKGVMEIYGSMGLDAHYMKRVASFRALVEFAMPIQKNISYDLSARKFKLVSIVPELNKPLVKFLIQQYAESVTLTNNFTATHVDQLPLCAHKVIPINKFYDLNVLGYKVGFVGQLPYQFDWQNPLHIMGGKTYIRLMKKPMKDSPKVVTLTGQLVFPLEINSAAQNFSRDEVNQRVPISKVTNSFNQEETSYSDPVDLDKEAISMHQLINKFEDVTERTTIPLHHVPETRGIILSLDASTHKTVRKSQVEALWSRLDNGRIASAFIRLWKSPMPDYTPKEWQMVTEFRKTYPVKVHEPKDTLSATWQKEILRDLQYSVSKSSHQASNYLLHSTLLSEINELNYPAMMRTPTSRLLDNLVPEQLYMVMDKVEVSKNRWQKYWAKLVSLHEKVNEEKKRLVDPDDSKRDSNILCYINKVLKIQSTMNFDLDEIIKEKSVHCSELPIIQWIHFYYTTMINDLTELIPGYITKNIVLTQVQNIQNLMKQAKENQESIIKKMKQVFTLTLSDNEEKQIKEKGNNFEMYKDYDVDQNAETDALYQVLAQLSLFQLEVIETLQKYNSRQQSCDIELIKCLTSETRNNITFFDQIWKDTPIYANNVIDTMLLVTIQNELIIHLLNVNSKLSLNTPITKSKEDTAKANSESFNLKIESLDLGQRVSSLNKQRMLLDVTSASLSEQELPIYNELKSIYRKLMVDRRIFEVNFAYNKWTHHDADVSETEVNKLLVSLNTYTTKLAELQKNVIDLDSTPNVYLATEFLGIIGSLRTTVDFCRPTLMAVTSPKKNIWIENFEAVSNNIQQLASVMSLIFDKFVTRTDEDQQTPLLFHPLDQTYQDIQKVTYDQDLLYERLVQDNDSANFKLPQLISEIERLQELLKKTEPFLLDHLQHKTTTLSFVSRYLQAFKKQRKIYQIIQTTLEDKNGEDENKVLAKFNELEKLHSKMEVQINQLLSEKKSSNTYQSENNAHKMSDPDEDTHPDLSSDNLPTYFSVITGTLNVSWGYTKRLENRFEVQMIATRSVQQLVHLYKQIDSKVRSTNVENAINDQLAGETWRYEKVMRRMNTYNHLHLTALYDKKVLPPWMLQLSQCLHESLKYYYWNHYTRHEPIESVSSDRTDVIVDLSNSYKDMNMFLMTGEETNKFLNIPAPYLLNKLKFNQNYKTIYDELTSSLSGGQTPAQCIISQESIRTFDQVTYPIPDTLGSCRAILAMDCSDEKTFAINMIRANSSSMSNAFQLLYESIEVEIQPSIVDILVKVNGNIIELEENKPVSFTKLLQYQRTEKYLIITKKDLGVHFSLPLAGISVHMDSLLLKIQVSELFKGRLCGLCGNFDYQVSWEYEGPSYEIYRTPKSFTYAYVLPDQTCPIPKDYKSDVEYYPPEKIVDLSQGIKRLKINKQLSNKSKVKKFKSRKSKIIQKLFKN